MRGIFFALLFLNVIAFAWGALMTSSEQVSPAPKRPAANPYQNIPELILLEELSPDNKEARVTNLYSSEYRNEAVGAKTTPAPAAPAAKETLATEAKVHDGKPLCELVGPFSDLDKADEFIERLNGIEVSGGVREIELPSGLGYWVYLKPLRSRKDALRRLNELQTKGVDSYVIPKGELENGISLGMFSQKSLADARLKEMTREGLDPQLKEIERSYREIWVMLDQGEGAKMSKYTWESLLDGTNMLERRQNYCLDVASQ